jgi:hypothetical protein
MKKTLLLVAASALCVTAGSIFAFAQLPPDANFKPDAKMNFFVTSIGGGHGGNLGGLAGADRHCQDLATAVGMGGKTWHAYMSTQARPGQPAINARDRIGAGPWYNSKGAMIAQDNAHLHGDTIELARMGNNINKTTNLTEKGQVVPGLYDLQAPNDRDEDYMAAHPASNRHETLTGSMPDGRAFTDTQDHTCNNWTSEGKGNSANLRENTGPAVQVGMSDRNGGGNGSWNSAHSTTGCGQADLRRTHGIGLYYCFAIN